MSIFDPVPREFQPQPELDPKYNARLNDDVVTDIPPLPARKHTNNQERIMIQRSPRHSFSYYMPPHAVAAYALALFLLLCTVAALIFLASEHAERISQVAVVTPAASDPWDQTATNPLDDPRFTNYPFEVIFLKP
jgi:hypothetical protein